MFLQLVEVLTWFFGERERERERERETKVWVKQSISLEALFANHLH